MAKEQQTGIFSNFGLLIVGLVVGAVAVILLNIHISNIRRQHEMDAIQVLQLTQDVKVGDKVTSRHIRTVDIPADFKEGFKGAIEAKLRFSIIDRRARKDMDRGKILLNADFDEDVTAAETAIKVPKGYSLFTTPVDVKISPGQLLRPGKYVNLVGRFNFGNRRDSRIRAITVIRQVQVQAIDGRAKLIKTGRSKSSYRKISFFVRPKDVETLMDLRSLIIGDYAITITNPEEKLAEGQRGISAAAMNFLKSRGR